MRHCTQCGASMPDDARFCPGCGASVNAGGGDPMLGKVIADRYLLVEKIGQGGSGVIYRGEHTTLRKRVAVKILHAQLSRDDSAVERFRREATTVAELDNDHILQVLDFGRTDDQRLFFAMEHLEGETLTKVLERDKTLTVTRTVDVLAQIAEALMEAHGLGYVHRDLRPRNIYLIHKRGRADFVKLLDFGLAKLVLPNSDAKQTAMGMTFGDPRYMSPEQARGESFDRRSDIYSLGAIAFEMLTGTPPYTGSGTFEILQKTLDAPVPRVREKRPDCPEWLDAVVQKALAKKAEGRFLTVLRMIECLRAQAAPGAADAAEQAAHARLTAERPIETAAVEAAGAEAASAPVPSAPVPSAPAANAPVATAPTTSAPPVNVTGAPVAPVASAPVASAPVASAPVASAPKLPSGPTTAIGMAAVIVPPAAGKAAPLPSSPSLAAVDQLPTPTAPLPRQTQAMTALSAPKSGRAAPGPGRLAVEPEPPPVVVAAAPSAPEPLPAPAPTTTPTPTTPTPTPTPTPTSTPTPGNALSASDAPAAAGSVEVTPPSTRTLEPENVPSVVVESTSQEKTLPARPPYESHGLGSGTGTLPAVEAQRAHTRPPTGEWFNTDSQPLAVLPSAGAPYEDLDDLPRPNRGPVIIGVVAGGLTLIGIIVIALLPKPQHKPLRGEAGATDKPAVAATPSGTSAQPTPPATPPSGASAEPAATAAPPSGATAAAEPTAAPSGASALPAPPPSAPEKAAAAAPPPAEKPKAAEKLAAKEPPAREPPPAAAKPAPPTPAKPAAVAAAKPAPKEPAARVEKVDKLKAPPPPTKVAAAPSKGSMPEGFKDPFAEGPKGESAQAEFFVKLGRQKLGSSDLSAAAANFNKAREYDARSADAVAGLGEVAFEQGDYNGAAVHLKQALRLSPNRPRYLVLLGQTYYKLGKPRDAVGEYKKALRIDPSNQEAQHSLEVAERKLQSGG